MLSLKTILLGVAFAPLAYSLPPFTVDVLDIFEPTGRPGQVNLYRVAFDVTDPSGGNAKATCQTFWDYADATTGWPSTYLANCTDPAFSFKFENWVNYMDFTLDVKHTTGNNPHSKRTKFAKAPINLDILQCSHAASGFSVCALKPGVVLELPVYDVQRE